MNDCFADSYFQDAKDQKDFTDIFLRFLESLILKLNSSSELMSLSKNGKTAENEREKLVIYVITFYLISGYLLNIGFNIIMS